MLQPRNAASTYGPMTRRDTPPGRNQTDAPMLVRIFAPCCSMRRLSLKTRRIP